jgi:hypothetical protein
MYIHVIYTKHDQVTPIVGLPWKRFLHHLLRITGLRGFLHMAQSIVLIPDFYLSSIRAISVLEFACANILAAA